MKKTFLLFATLCVAQVGFAQLKVDAAGKVGIGTTPQTHKLEVAGNTLVTGNIYIGGTSNSLATTGNTPIVFKVNNSVESGYTGSSGNYKVAFGYGALSNITGGYNTAIGYEALRANTGGTHNTANGHAALCANTTGRYNSANSMDALRLNTTGSNNTAIGFYALHANTTGSYNTAIGDHTSVSANNLNNATVIGSNARATASNQVRIGNSSVTSIGGYTAWTNLSDGRAKKNIRADVGTQFHQQPATGYV